MYQVRAIAAATFAAATSIAAANAGEPMKITFVDHVTAGMIEQDVYVEREPGSGQVWRINADERDAFADAVAYRTAAPQHHSPMDPANNGPYAAGEPFDFKVGEWLSGTGTATYACDGKTTEFAAQFTGLVPNGTYTLWNFFMATPVSQPFSTYDLPMGARDGSQTGFVTDANGNADYQVSFDGCLQMSGAQLASGIAINYHSDGNTYGPHPGEFGTISHIQLFAVLPSQDTVVAQR